MKAFRRKEHAETVHHDKTQVRIGPLRGFGGDLSVSMFLCFSLSL